MQPSHSLRAFSEKWLPSLVLGLFLALFFSRSLVVVLSALVLLWGGAQMYLAEGRRVVKYPLAVPFALLFAAVLLSIALAAPYPWQGPLGKWRYYFAYFPLVFLFARYPQLPRRLGPFAIVVALLLGVLSWLQYQGVAWTGQLKGHGLSPVPGDPLHFQARGFAPHHTLFSSMVVVLLLFLLTHFLLAKDRRERGWYAAGVFFAGFSLFASFSRGSWLAAVAGAVILLIGQRGKKALAGVLAIVAVLVATALVVPSFRERGAKLSLNQNRDRVALWESALRMFKESPLTGKGFHSYGHYQKQYFTESERAEFHYAPAEVHNIYLDLLAGTGLIGLGCFLALIGVAIKNWLWAYGRRSPEDELPLLASLSTLAAVLVNNLTDSHLYSTNGAMGAVFFLAMGQAVYWRKKEATRQ